MNMNFDKKICLVTGGTSGIGLKTTELLLKQGATVVILGRDQKRGQDCLLKLNGNIEFISCDVASYDEVKIVFDHIINKYKKLDLAFNNAGITSKYKKIGDIEPEEWQNVMRINIGGIYNCLHHELNLMSKNTGGSIVNMSSCVSINPIGFQSPYISSKYAVNGLTKSAAIEYADSNIRVNAIAPGPTLGGMNSKEKLEANPQKTKRKIDVTAMKRFADPEEVAKAVLWLLSDESSYITGAIVPVDGGYNAGKF